MSKKIKIEYLKEKCIGRGNCTKISPELFTLEADKAILKNASNVSGQNYSLDLNVDEAACEQVVEAARSCPVNAIKVKDLENNIELVTIQVKEDEMVEVSAQYDDEKEFILDPAGYFLIRINAEDQTIEVAFCNERNTAVLKVTGKKPIDIYHTILNNQKLDIRKDHAAYLGRELQKAYIALTHKLSYVQDGELNFNESVSTA